MNLTKQQRRELRDQIAFERAEFERAYAGRSIAPFDREAIAHAIPRRYRHANGVIAFNLSDRFVRECQAQVPAMHKMIERQS